MSKVIDLVGKRFGMLTVTSRSKNNKSGKTTWNCKCDCGKDITTLADSLHSGKTRSCGCYRKITCKQNSRHTHRMTGTRLWIIWGCMKSRCYYAKNIAYSSYGGRGIKICEEWKKNFISFHDWAVNNGYSDNLTIDRIDNNGNYEPSNCKWSTFEEQENNKSNTIYMTVNGETLPVCEWARKSGISAATLRWRIINNWCESDLLIHPNFNNKNIRRAI